MSKPSRLTRMQRLVSRLVGGPRGRAAARLRRRMAGLVLAASALLVTAPALANQDRKPAVYMADECSEVTKQGGRVLVCTRESASGRVSATVFVRWRFVADDDGSRWVVGWRK